MIASLTSFAVNLGINFFLSPYIVSSLGVEAYGFVALANNFVSYASIVTIALNAMAGRYITIAIHQKDYERANKYFNSVIISNIIIAAVLLIPAFFAVNYIEILVNVPHNILIDVKMLLAFVFLNFLIGVCTSTWGVAFFATNNLYKQSGIGICTNFLRAILIVCFFALLDPSVYFIGLTSCITTVVTVFFNVINSRKLLPCLIINKKYYDFKALKELISVGIWNSLTQLSQILLSGLDLLLANLFVSSTAMGVLALAKTVPQVLMSLMSTVTSIFSPNLTFDYAEGRIDNLVDNVKSANKMLTFIIGIPMAIFVSLGMSFYELWVPTQDSIQLQALSVLTMGVMFVSLHIQVLYQVFTLTKKVKTNSIIMIVSGVVTIIFVFLLLKMANLGIFAIAGVSVVVGLVRNLIFTPIYAAKCLSIKWNTFYSSIVLGLLNLMGISAMTYGVGMLISVTTWFDLFIVVAISVVLALIFDYMLLLNKKEKLILKHFIKKENSKND